MLGMIVSTDADRGYLPVVAEEEVVLLLNNLGGTSNLEMNIILKVRVIVLCQTFRMMIVLWQTFTLELVICHSRVASLTQACV
jgi:hypothetical protein